MAERRMFAKTIIDSDAFLDMPLSAQALYFHLSMRADDDGFVNNPKKIQRMVGASDDDCNLLIMNRFIITFESGVVVIKHWKIHNYIQKDRYKPTLYQEEKSLLTENENKAYTERIHDVYITDTQVRDRIEIDKENIDKESVGEEEPTPTPPTLDEIIDYIHNNNLSVNPNRFFSYYNDREWKTANGKPIKWEQKLQEWDFDDKQKAKANAKSETQASNNPFLELVLKEICQRL